MVSRDVMDCDCVATKISRNSDVYGRFRPLLFWRSPTAVTGGG
jgi:hypothetical protein